jgi:hypothetical protein
MMHIMDVNASSRGFEKSNSAKEDYDLNQFYQQIEHDDAAVTFQNDITSGFKNLLGSQENIEDCIR